MVAASERACARANVYNSSSTSTLYTWRRGDSERWGSSADLLLSLSSLSLLSLYLSFSLSGFLKATSDSNLYGFWTVDGTSI